MLGNDNSGIDGRYSRSGNLNCLSLVAGLEIHLDSVLELRARDIANTSRLCHELCSCVGNSYSNVLGLNHVGVDVLSRHDGRVEDCGHNPRAVLCSCEHLSLVVVLRAHGVHCGVLRLGDVHCHPSWAGAGARGGWGQVATAAIEGALKVG